MTLLHMLPLYTFQQPVLRCLCLHFILDHHFVLSAVFLHAMHDLSISCALLLLSDFVALETFTLKIPSMLFDDRFGMFPLLLSSMLSLHDPRFVNQSVLFHLLESSFLLLIQFLLHITCLFFSKFVCSLSITLPSGLFLHAPGFPHIRVTH